MTNQQYDTLKMIALILTPVLAFLASLTNIWHVPYAEQIVATLTALDTLIGAIVVIANKQYKGEMQ
jgi:small basic protein